MNPLIKRQKATDATAKHFGGKPFAWGSVDCAKMAAFHLRRLGKKVSLSRFGQYRTAQGAASALKRKGFASIIEAVDDLMLERIAPAYMLIGDLIAWPGDDPIGSLAIYAGNGNVMCFHHSNEFLVTFLPAPEAMAQAVAWKVI